jgi:hypothetical protein
MAGLDPLQKFETLVFQKVGERTTAFGVKMVYRQLPYKYVEYDGNPQRFIEPIATATNPAQTVVQLDAIGGQVVGWEIVDGRAMTGFSMGEKIDPTSPTGF